MKRLTGIAIGGFLAGLLLLANTVVTIHPKLATDAVSKDPDDPAIWVHRGDPNRSLILGTNKTPVPGGALLVFGLDGKIRQTISGIDRPNNVDVEYGFKLQGKRTDIAVRTERLRKRLRIFAVAPDGSKLEDLSPQGLPVFAGQSGEQAAPMGVALYRRPKDGAIFAIVSRKEGPPDGYLWQYRLQDDGTGKVAARKVREFGRFSGAGEIEAVAIDDELGYAYYADEGDGIHKWHADPDHPEAARELSHFGKDGFQADREGIAIYVLPGGKGYIVCTDQFAGSSEYRVYRREGEPGKPHDHSTVRKVFRGGADSTDGIEISSAALGPQFPNGLMAAMNSGGRNFLIFSWEDIAKTGEPQLQMRHAKRLAL
ncbi:MAG: phytase [Acidobacteria bacterium]|nr:phytase [Acidobacteriota bacterium]